MLSSADGPYVAGTAVFGQAQIDAKLCAMMHEVIQKHLPVGNEIAMPLKINLIARNSISKVASRLLPVVFLSASRTLARAFIEDLHQLRRRLEGQGLIAVALKSNSGLVRIATPNLIAARSAGASCRAASIAVRSRSLSCLRERAPRRYASFSSLRQISRSESTIRSCSTSSNLCAHWKALLTSRIESCSGPAMIF